MHDPIQLIMFKALFIAVHRLNDSPNFNCTKYNFCIYYLARVDVSTTDTHIGIYLAWYARNNLAAIKIYRACIPTNYRNHKIVVSRKLD